MMETDRYRVVMVDPGGRGGLCHYSYGLCQALARLGCEVHLITGDPYELTRFPRNFEVHAFQLREMGGLLASWARIHALRPDVIHQQGTNSHPVFEWVNLKVASLVAKAPVVYTSHQNLPHRAIGWQKPFIGAKLRSAGAVVVHTGATRDEAIDLFNVPGEKLNLIPHGDYRFFRTLTGLGQPLAWRKEPGVKDILSFGNISAYKGLMYLIDAVGRLRRSGRAIRLMIVGNPSEDWTPYEAELTRQGLNDSALLALGYLPIEDVPAYFEFADAVCLPYVEGGSDSGVLHLAHAFDKPVVATQWGGNQETHAEGYIQELIPPRDVDALTHAIDRLLFPTEAASHSAVRAGRDDAPRSWPVIAATTLGLYRRLATGKSQSLLGIPEIAS